MNEIQKFIANNQGQLGYIMQEASRQWKVKDKIGALTVGTANVFVERYGDYHEVLEKMLDYRKRMIEAGRRERNLEIVIGEIITLSKTHDEKLASDCKKIADKWSRS